jgi:NADH dehydrogenase [ubiquinone] 1 alpha subcomplex assembly factor 7
MNELARRLAQRIRDAGPLTVGDYMMAALGDPAHGYYATRDPLGRDFITAPEISQMFGELIGLWCAETWRVMGAPQRLVLAELGPGRGTLLADALRALRLVPAFLAAAELHLVETGAALRAVQARMLAEYSPRWHRHVEELPDGPTIVIANEFLDALPVRQFVRTEQGWRERRIGLGPGGGFTFILDPACVDMAGQIEAPVGGVREISPRATRLAEWLGHRVSVQGGVALLIDYGYISPASGDTLQALRAHRRHDFQSDPGEADLTAHVDFAAVAQAASAASARVYGPVAQGQFLQRLGIETRAAGLKAAASDQAAATIASGYRRLVDPHAMGELFKVLAIADPALPSLAGFAEGMG